MSLCQPLNFPTRPLIPWAFWALIFSHWLDGFTRRHAVHFTGLGELNPSQLRSLFETRHPLTQGEPTLGSEAWKAFCSPDPSSLVTFLRKDTSALPFLKAALLRHLEQFPALEGGLSRTERQILEVVAQGIHTPLEIFRATQEKEESPFMGDAPFWSYLSGLCRGKKPLLTRADGGMVSFPTGASHDPAFREQVLLLTEEGRNALVGQADWIKINRGIFDASRGHPRAEVDMVYGVRDQYKNAVPLFGQMFGIPPS